MNQSIRVAVANRPRLMRDLVVSIMADQSDIEVVAEIHDESQIADVVAKTTPEFLIIALDSSNRRPSLCDSLLRRFPQMKILALAPEDRRSLFYWLSAEICETSIETSESGILCALRSNHESRENKLDHELS